MASSDYDIRAFFTSAVSVDNVIFGFDGEALRILLVERGVEPHEGMWALPGDMVRGDEDLDGAAQRVLTELTSMRDVYLEQIVALGRPDRHPTGRVVTVAYLSLIRERPGDVQPAGWARRARYFPTGRLPVLAFDHADIVALALERLRHRVRTQPVGLDLLPDVFTLSELQQLYEAILGVELDKRNFRKKILALGIVRETGRLQENVNHRPARLYEIDGEQYERARNGEFAFAV